MEFLSPPKYSARCTELHGEWFGRTTTPASPEHKALWLKQRELAWDNSVRRYTPASIKGLKPVTLEPWADETITVESSFERFGDNFDDVQGQMLRCMMSYKSDTTSQRQMKTVLRRDHPKLYKNTLQ